VTHINKFGNDYIDRNISDQYLASNLSFFSKIFSRLQRPASLVEFGANVGMNLRAIQLINPGIEVFGVEINSKAAEALATVIGAKNVFNGSILDFDTETKYDIAMTKGLLIHIQPDMLAQVYDKLHAVSSQYLLICEYYNPAPVSARSRGSLVQKRFCR
jgi:spore coat polysaccharide biosynthesis protein SpsF